MIEYRGLVRCAQGSGVARFGFPPGKRSWMGGRVYSMPQTYRELSGDLRGPTQNPRKLEPYD